jgi:hypothetical protein
MLYNSAYLIYEQGLLCRYVDLTTVCYSKEYWFDSQKRGELFLVAIQQRLWGPPSLLVRFFLWRCDPMRAMASSFMRFLDDLFQCYP